MHPLPLNHIKLIGCRRFEFAPAVIKIVAQFIGLQQWMPPFALMESQEAKSKVLPVCVFFSLFFPSMCETYSIRWGLK